MSPFLISAYILIWPTISALVLIVLCLALWRDYRQAKKDGEELV